MDSTPNLRQATPISLIHQDIIENLILTRLDCLTLASLSCTCSYFHTLASQDTLWRDICLSIWPSINDNRIMQLITTLPRGYCTFFSDCYPLIEVKYNQPKTRRTPLILPSELISAVDVWYQNKPIFSRVIQSETGSEWFRHSPFRVDVLHPKEAFSTTAEIDEWDDDTWQEDLLGNLTLSWIMIDSRQKRAANFSALKPVSVQRHWLTGEVRAEYGTVLGWVQCKIVLMCGGRKEKGELFVREVCMYVENVDGKYLNGEDSLVILVSAMKFGKRIRGQNGKERKRHEDFMEMVRLRNENKVFVERMLDMVCVVLISIGLTFSTLYLVGRW